MSAQADPTPTVSGTASPNAASAPADGPRVVYDRPPPGLARGTWSAPAWVVVVLGLLVIGAIVAFFVMRHRRDKAPDSTLGPQSVPPSSRQ